MPLSLPAESIHDSAEKMCGARVLIRKPRGSRQESARELNPPAGSQAGELILGRKNPGPDLPKCPSRVWRKPRPRSKVNGWG